MSFDLGNIAAALGGGMVTFLIAWGAQRGKLAEYEGRIVRLEKEADHKQHFIVKTREEFFHQVHSLHETYVTHQQFNEAMRVVRENYKDLKEDMKLILELLKVNT